MTALLVIRVVEMTRPQRPRSVSNLPSGSVTGNPQSEDDAARAVGEFMRKRVFEPGRTLNWNELTKHATGEPLTANIAWYTRHGYVHERLEDMGDRRIVHLIKQL